MACETTTSEPDRFVSDGWSIPGLRNGESSPSSSVLSESNLRQRSQWFVNATSRETVPSAPNEVRGNQFQPARYWFRQTLEAAYQRRALYAATRTLHGSSHDNVGPGQAVARRAHDDA